MSGLRDTFRVLDTPDKGRVCVAMQEFKPGDILFDDQAFVHASELPHRCLACCEDHEAVDCESVLKAPGALSCPGELLVSLDAAADEMCDFDGVNTLDRARCFIQCMLMYRNDRSSLEPLGNLTAANLPRCLESVVGIRTLIPALIPQDMRDDDAAYILAILNTNSHELEQVEGSGLFLTACIMEHDCNPNCSFTTFGDTIWLTAIRDVEQGDRLSIDYGNNFYLPTADRRMELEDVYGFVCSCRGCTILPDRCRAFRCPAPACLNGKVCPHGDGDDSPGEEQGLWTNWGCLVCAHHCLPAEVDVMLAKEEEIVQRLEEMDELGVDEIDSVVAETGWIHPTHFAVFWALEGTAKSLSGQSASERSSHRVAIEAERAWSRVVEAVDESLPALHHEKVVYLDALAQARVVAGDIEGARQAYKSAYEISALVSGADTPPTLDVKSLWEKPPTSARELRARYNASP